MVKSLLKIIELILTLVNRHYSKEKDLDKEFRETLASGDLDVASDILRKRVGDIKKQRADNSASDGSK